MRASPHGRSGALVSAGAAVRVASAVLLFLSAAEAWVAPAFLGNTALGSRHRAAGEGLLGKLGGRNGPVLRLWLGEKAVCARSRLVGMALSEESNSGGKQADRRRSTALSSSAPVGRSAEGKQGGDAPPDIAGSKRVVGSRYAGGAASFPQLVSFDDAGKMLEAIAPFLTQDSRGRYPITGRNAAYALNQLKRLRADGANHAAQERLVDAAAAQERLVDAAVAKMPEMELKHVALALNGAKKAPKQAAVRLAAAGCSHALLLLARAEDGDPGEGDFGVSAQ
ncbi:hypothetical protein T484DRAFT_1782513, partial [Baffinella frigidus]